METLSPEGLRLDGRRWNELRSFTSRISLLPDADGSSYIEHGNTKVLCAVRGPREPLQRGTAHPEKAIITVDLSVPAFSTTDRKKRSRTDKRLQEWSMLVEDVFSGGVLVGLTPRSEISVSLQVLSQDGGMLADCVNAVTLAIVDAGIPISNYICACTAGSYDNEPLLDLNNVEENDMAYCTVATQGATEDVALLQMETRLHQDKFENMFSVAIAGCAQIKEMMDKTVRKTSKAYLDKLEEQKEYPGYHIQIKNRWEPTISIEVQ
ncbi:hypothetical protein G7K_4293-t1 [Saitoella complicata NRRL Y-17804]|uniref:Ribosomal RNA-processing protein 41 n=2 Tax=Saitoella complicata (strain BCRC 22490 / CBS 7301 / JCM 7358 / NBRC 10748 / NRRL Y-17804) TaxID=698492 RepID=A0A0E9NJZ0_SAICN|nr:hypothetical protein G7K_4293-t1 [Saitoella complicata NRRL Y-17804]